MRVALVHDWLTGMRGGERVLELFCEMFPDAPIYTLLHVPGSVSGTIAAHPIVTSFLQRLPGAAERYRHYLPLFPRAVESLRLPACDLVLSSSHAVVKSVRPPAGAVHVCYCFTPMRYAWDLQDDYFGPGRASPAVRLAARVVLPWLRRWDRRTADRVHRFVAISRTIEERIRRVYGRESAVLEPPVDTDFFTPLPDQGPGDAYLVVSALVPYKRVDLVVEAFRGRPERLRVVGKGPELPRLSATAPPNVTFVGDLTDEGLRDEYRACRGLIHAAVEDFGIAPVEAMACGRPVIGLGRGALTETVVPGVSGLLFPEQTPSSLRASLDSAGGILFNCAAVREAALRFSRGRFRERFRTIIDESLGRGHGAGPGLDRTGP